MIEMKKRIFLVLILAAIIPTGVFAQHFWISGEASVLGGGGSFEVMLFDKLSVSINGYTNNLFNIFGDSGVNLAVRFYPAGKIFFAGLGIGFNGHTWQEELWNGSFVEYQTKGFCITPEIGWKIDVGQTGKLFIQPGIKALLTLGDNDIGFGAIPYFGLGYAF